MILDTDEKVLKQPFEKPLSYNLLNEIGCTMLDSSEYMIKIKDLKIVRDLLKFEPTSRKSDIERLELKIQQLEDKRHPDLWRFTYKGQEILFNSDHYTNFDDFGDVTEVVLHTDTDIIIHTFQDFLDGLDKVVEYQIEQKKSFIIEKSDNGKTYQQPVQRNLLCKQRLPKFQKSVRCYRSPGMFRYRNR